MKIDLSDGLHWTTTNKVLYESILDAVRRIEREGLYEGHFSFDYCGGYYKSIEIYANIEDSE